MRHSPVIDGIEGFLLAIPELIRLSEGTDGGEDSLSIAPDPRLPSSSYVHFS